MSTKDNELNSEIAVIDVKLAGLDHTIPWYFDLITELGKSLLILPACTAVESFSIRYCKLSEIMDGPNDSDELLNWLSGESAMPDKKRHIAITSAVV